MYSVKDRIDLGKLSDVRPTDGKSLYDHLSSTEDYKKLNKVLQFTLHVLWWSTFHSLLKTSAVLYSDTYLTNTPMKCH